MIFVNIPLSDDVALVALEQARDSGVEFEEFIVELVRKGLGAPSEGTASTFDDWLEDAVRRATKIAAGSDFKLQDLFDKDEWKRIPSPTVFGRSFRKRVEQDQLAAHVGRTQMNQAIYRRG